MPGLQSQRPRQTGTNVRSVICSLRDVVAMGKLDEVAAGGARLIGLEQRTDPFSNASRSVKIDTSQSLHAHTPHTTVSVKYNSIIISLTLHHRSICIYYSPSRAISLSSLTPSCCLHLHFRGFPSSSFRSVPYVYTQLLCSRH